MLRREPSDRSSTRHGLRGGAAFSPDGSLVSYSFPHEGDTRFVPSRPRRAGTGAASPMLSKHPDLLVDAGRPLSPNPGQRHHDGGSVLQPLDGGARRIDTGGAVPSSSLSVSRSGQIAMLASEPNRPTELYAQRATGGAFERLTDFNAPIAALDLAPGVARCGRDMDGVLTYPPGYQTGRYPLVLLIHGGPRGTSTVAFSARAQWLASHGWVVFEPNYRGGDGRGTAFQAAIWNDARGPAGTSCRASTCSSSEACRSGPDGGVGVVLRWLHDHLAPRQLPGPLACRCGRRPRDRSHRSVRSQRYQRARPNLLRRLGSGPITGVPAGPITTPRTSGRRPILCNTGDQRVPITESFILYHVLRDNGVKTQFIAYPVDGHFPADPVHQRDIDRRWAAWLKEHLDDNAP